MDSLSNWIITLFIVSSLIYIVYFHPKREEEREHLKFDSLVLGFIDGLYLTEIEFGCTAFDMRRYIKQQLAKAHALPGNQFLIEYTTAAGNRFCSHTGNTDHALFAILCIAQYAREQGNTELITWCESMMDSARRNSINY